MKITKRNKKLIKAAWNWFPGACAIPEEKVQIRNLIDLFELSYYFQKVNLARCKNYTRTSLHKSLGLSWECWEHIENNCNYFFKNKKSLKKSDKGKF